MLKISRIRLHSLYLTKKIEASAIKTVLASSYKTAYRLLMVTNGVKELQEFAESDHPDYFLTALVRTEYALAGEAREQAWNVKHLQPLLQQKTRYVLRCTLTHRISNRDIYKSELVSKRPQDIYSEIQECISDLTNILEEKLG